jgi:carboxyl-terminal processing protease
MVLVNDHTASASEIVAAALHDNCRALLVGRRTFGKGLIQSVYELSDGSGIILTVGKYVTPGHHDIDGNGIEPDFKRPPGLQEAKQKLGRCHLVKEASNTMQPLALLL